MSGRAIGARPVPPWGIAYGEVAAGCGASGFGRARRRYGCAFMVEHPNVAAR
jgi:hypothetical protein